MTKVRHQLSSHGAGRYSVQVFGESGELLADVNIVKEVNGWKVVRLRSDGFGVDDPQHSSPQAAAEWYAALVSEGE